MTMALSLETGVPIAIPIGAAKAVDRSGYPSRWERCKVGSSERTPSVVLSVSYSSRPGSEPTDRSVARKGQPSRYRGLAGAGSCGSKCLFRPQDGQSRTTPTFPAALPTTPWTDGAWKLGWPR